MARLRVQGWDPVLLVCQIISMQAIHYLFLALITPPLLNAFSSSSLLAYSGGASTVGHILDWREMASRPTIPGSLTGSGVGAVGLDSAASGWGKLRGAWSGGKQISKEVNDPAGQGLDDSARIGGGDIEVWDFGIDDSRGWTMGVCWLIAAAFDILPLYYLIRRPTYILDFSLTLTFVHLILTTYFAGSFPTSLYWWVVQALGALLMIVVAEQLCVQREMRTDLDIGWNSGQGEDDIIELNER